MSHQDSSNKPTAATGAVLLSPEVEQRHVPKTYRMGRNVPSTASYIKNHVFALDNPTAFDFTKADFCAFNFAIVQALSNQSHQYGHTDTYSGTTPYDMREVGMLGVVKISMSDFCRYGYGQDGTPTTKHRKAITALMRFFHNTYVPIKFKGEDEPSLRPLILIIGQPIKDKYGSKTYELAISTFYSEDLRGNFGEYPQDLMKRIRANTDRVTEAHFLLAWKLGGQAKGSSLIRFIDDKVGGFVDDLGLLDSYKTQRVRTEKQLLSLFETMKSARLITDYKVEYIAQGGKKRMNKVAFQMATKQQMLDAPTGTEE